MSEAGQTIASTQSLVLDLPPSCIEFCRTHPSYFVVGTYDLQRDDKPEAKPAASEDDDDDNSSDQEKTVAAKKPQNRNGTLVVFKLVNKTIHNVQVVSQPSAILDLHFCPVSGKEDILAVVSSTGTLAILQLDPSSDESSPLKHITTSTIADMPDGVLFLSCAWHPSDPKIMAVTTSSNDVCLVRLDDDWKIRQDDPYPVLTHSLEAWTVAFSPPASSDETGRTANDLTVYSGGDDSALRYVALGATGLSEESQYGLLFPPLKLDAHDAGVTAILPTSCHLHDGSRIILTGSYDDTFRILAVHSPRKTYGARKYRQIAEEFIGGGVWRLKLVHAHQEKENWHATILASCMHAGARVLEVTGSLDGVKWDIKVLACFEEHKSMNYGSDFAPGTGVDSKRLVCVSTSFYDKLLCLWDV
ncbi:hypothetical protein ACHAQH_001436 [Verticillium albo-atrum]